MDHHQRQGASRRHVAPTTTSSSNDGFYSMDYSATDMSFVSGSGAPEIGRRSATNTPGPTSAGGGPSGPSNFSNPYGGSGGGGFGAPMDQNFASPLPPPQPSQSQQQQQQPQQSHSQFNQQYGQPGFGGGGGGITNPFGVGGGMQQQFLMAAGEQLLTNPMTKAAIDAYSQSIVDRSKTWLGSAKCYFAVDTSYVVKKLMLIFLPFLHKDWCIRYQSEAVTPRDEPNLPDLYIPSMAFITYCLLSGYILGMQNRFEPEQLGIYASSALAWLLLEVAIIVIAKYVLNMSSILGFFHLIAFGGYKFVCVVAILLLTILFGATGFTAAFGYSSFTLMYFLLRSLNANLQTSNSSNYGGNESPRTGQYLVIVICLFQPIVMYFLTNSLKNG